MAKIEVFGLDNYVLIDNNYKNMILAQKNSITFPVPTVQSVKGSSVQVSYNSPYEVPPLLAINSSFPVVVFSMKREGNAYTWNLVCSEAGRGASVEYFIFHLPETVPNAGGLIKLYNTQNQLVFDSNLVYCKAERMFSYPLDGNLSLSVTPGRKYACVTSLAAGEFFSLQYPPLTNPPLYGVAQTRNSSGFWMQDGLIRTSKFTYTYRTYAVQSPTTESYRNSTGTLLVLDVTGM